MISKRLYNGLLPHSWDIPSDVELILIVLNYVSCVPVLLLVGGFSLYHFYLLAGNSTTIEGWEKEKVSTMIRKGKIQELKFPYNLGVRRNFEAVLGRNPWLWCWPNKTPGSGLKFEIAGDGKWIELTKTRDNLLHDRDDRYTV
jgi:palmitoyltransferase